MPETKNVWLGEDGVLLDPNNPNSREIVSDYF